jgi:putative flippase GtrA
MAAMQTEVWRITRFGIVGIVATLTHMAVAHAGLALLTNSPYLASLAGFLSAFCVSYLGHYHFTFGADSVHSKALPRFVAIAVTGFLTSLVVIKAVTFYGLPPDVSLTVSILLIPGLTYIASRLWAFR